MGNEIYGLTRINEMELPYSYDYDKELINVYFGSKFIEVPDEMDAIIGHKLDSLVGGETLYKLSVPLENNIFSTIDGESKMVLTGTHSRYVEYYIENYTFENNHTEMRLQFPELDYFLPSKSKAKYEDNTFTLPLDNDNVYNFDIDYCGDKISVFFNIRAEAHFGLKAESKTITEVIMKFPKTNDIDYIYNLYSRTRDFFSFVCNRTNIDLNSTTLIGERLIKKIEDGKIVEKTALSKQKIFFSKKYLEPNEEMDKLKKVPYAGLFNSNIRGLFQLFFEEKKGELATINSSSVHPSFKYRNFIDLKQSLHITATFECYVRKLLPEMSSKTTLELFKDIKNLFDKYIETLTGKKKKKAKDFIKHLRPQISLKDKVIKVYKGYTDWAPLAPILSEWFGEDVSKIADAINMWRNELAHEKQEYEPDINTINAVRLVEHMNYCIVLRKAGYSDEEVKAIVSEILTR